MLILTRRPGESIMIENSDVIEEGNSEETGSETGSIKLEDSLITITVLRTKGGQISLGINAPSSFKIYREEIYPRKRGHKSIPQAEHPYNPGYDSGDSDEEGYY